MTLLHTGAERKAAAALIHQHILKPVPPLGFPSRTLGLPEAEEVAAMLPARPEYMKLLLLSSSSLLTRPSIQPEAIIEALHLGCRNGLAGHRHVLAWGVW